ncbi:uncharacterized protein LOC121731222 [Aricia agestis]|uniref:uncharacterized protein LOC121731222 n=1 Tax=Aricia agestis TaxID=91739 RepID=UPI001C208672|nr:uncharacterized protein LOC121731222 [Aricia agestis]
MKRRHNKISTSQRQSEQSESDDDSGSSTPPARKLLKKLLEKNVQQAVQDLQDDEPSISKSKHHRAASLIPEFDPDVEEYTIAAWIKKVDQIGDIHGWNDEIKSFYLQDKLRGQAKKWYNRLDNYDYSYIEWKEMLLRAFPKHRDYGGMLEELLRRKKLPTESMTKYYQDKIALCFRCKLSDNASVSCIIRGLPISLQANARAFQCQTPGELYEGFLCALDDYNATSHDPGWQKTNRQVIDKKIFANPETDPCPRCKKTGHLLRNCSLPDTRTCFKCGKQGHIALRCPSSSLNNKITNTSNSTKEINLLSQYSDNVYKKIAKINGVHVKAYIDTGSQVNVLNQQVASALSLEIKPTSVVLKGFSGGLTTSQGEVDFQLEIDGITMQCQAHLSSINMNGVNLLIGQPIINSNGITLTISRCVANFEYVSNSVCETEAVEENNKFKVVTTSEERLPPGASIVRVQVLGNRRDNDVVTPPRHYNLHGVSFSLPATLMRGEEGYIKVVNMGSETIVWPKGEVLTRAESCEEPHRLQPVSQSIGQENVCNMLTRLVDILWIP